MVVGWAMVLGHLFCSAVLNLNLASLVISLCLGEALYFPWVACPSLVSDGLSAFKLSLE